MKFSALLFYVTQDILAVTVLAGSYYDDYDDDGDFFKDLCYDFCDKDEIFDDVEDAFKNIQDEFIEREKKLNDKASSGWFLEINFYKLNQCY